MNDVIHRCGVVFATILALSGGASLPSVQAAGPEPAQSAQVFVDSIGVCTHWTYPDTPYGSRYPEVKQLLVESGIRHIRDGWSSRIMDLAKSGVKTTLVVDADKETPLQLKDKIKALNAEFPSIDAVEGPNEPDLFWAKNKRTYQGKGFPEGPIAFQKDLYAALKSDPATRDLPVIGPSCGVTYDAGGGKPNPLGNGTMTDCVDWGNFHPYPGGNPFSFPAPYGTLKKYYWQANFPSVNLDEWPFAFKTYAPPFAPKPMAATETGYSTYKTKGVSEAVHAKYMPRLFCEYFRLGIKRTCSYEFLDEWKRPEDREANFGLLRNDLSPKPAYQALKNMIALLGEKTPQPQFTPTALDYSLQVEKTPPYDRTQYVHHLLLQKSSGDFYLVLWHEISNEDTSEDPPRQITVPALPAKLLLNQPFKTVMLYRPNQSGAAIQTIKQPSAIALEIPDEVLIIRLVK